MAVACAGRGSAGVGRGSREWGICADRRGSGMFWACEATSGGTYSSVLCSTTVPRVFEGVVVSDVSAGLEAVLVELVCGVWGFSYKAGER
jgi:hypothetical protein